MDEKMNIFGGCGIAGIMLPGEKKVPDKLKDTFNQMLDSLKHRGPDGSGVFSFENVLLGHRRLSILDISSKGSQPMTRDHLTITLNGEIYNFHEIRKNLQSDGFTFSSETDTEVVLRSYQKWGINALLRFNGMFAFAIWDNIKKCLFIARDRLGKKPFYYYSDKNIFIFGSEIMPLLLSGYVEREIDYTSFEQQLFATSFFETDLSRTLVNNVKSIPPGYYMNIYTDGKIELNKYWDIPEQKNSIHNVGTNYLERLDELLQDSVRLRMISDVPVSGFLSGGIDSSLINYYANKQTKENHTCITIQYSDGGSDPYSDKEDLDLIYSKEFIQQFNNKIEHKIITLESSEITLEQIDEIIDLASLSDDDRMLSILKNYECVKNLGFKVVLNGQGADEIMGGYLGLKLFYETMFDAKIPENEIIKKMFPAQTIPGSALLNQNSIGCRNKVYANVFDYYHSFKGKPAEKIHRFLTKSQLLRVLQLEDFLSMRNSVECRLPFLDYRIVEFVFEIPFQMHFISETRTGKKLLREIALKYLSESIAFRPKQAFPVSRSDKKFRQILEIFNNHKSLISNSSIIRQYFNTSIFNFSDSNISLSELWQIIIIWRWEEKLKHIQFHN